MRVRYTDFVDVDTMLMFSSKSLSIRIKLFLMNGLVMRMFSKMVLIGVDYCDFNKDDADKGKLADINNFPKTRTT